MGASMKVLPLYPSSYLESEHPCTLAQLSASPLTLFMMPWAKVFLEILIPPLHINFSLQLATLQNQMQGQLQDIIMGKV